MNEKLTNKIISVAYNDANLADKFYISLRSIGNRKIKNMLEEYRVTAKSVNSINEMVCPEYLFNYILPNEVEAGNKKNFMRFSQKPAFILSSAFAVATMIYILLTNIDRNNQDYVSEMERREICAKAKKAAELLDNAIEPLRSPLFHKLFNDNTIKEMNRILEGQN